MVFTMRHPPVSVPSAIAACALRITHRGMTFAVVRCSARIGKSTNAARAANSSPTDRKSTRLNSSHSQISYAVFCLKKKRRLAQTRADHLIGQMVGRPVAGVFLARARTRSAAGAVLPGGDYVVCHSSLSNGHLRLDS